MVKKIKDLPPNTNMGGIKVKTPDGKVGYWASQWHKGIWLSAHPTGGGKIYPQFINDLQECLEWELADVDEPINL